MGKTAGKLSEKATRNPPGKPSEISYGHAILQPTIYNLSTVARQGPEKQSAASGNILRKLHGKHRREAVTVNPPKTRRENRRKAHMDAPSSSPPSTIYQQSPGKALKKQSAASGNILRGLHGENHREADRQIHPKPAGDHREDAGKTFGNTARKTLLRVASRPCEGKACAHIPICQRTSLSISSIHLSASHHTPPKHPVTPLMGLGCVNPAPTACGTAAPLLVGWGCVCIEPKHPVPQNAAGGKPLLVGLPPSTPTAAPFGTKRSTQAPYSWGLGA